MSLLSKQKKVLEKPAASRIERPRRAAATNTKTYKEPETDDSQSELEVALLVKEMYIYICPFLNYMHCFYFSRKEICIFLSLSPTGCGTFLKT